MSYEYLNQIPDIDPNETREWTEAVTDIVEVNGSARAQYLLGRIMAKARDLNVALPFETQTPYINTIPTSEEPEFPGDEMMEKKIRRIIRWNAMAMVARANKGSASLGGHISTYASSASLYEVGFNHFFRGQDAPGGGDQIYFQGHAAPGIYARAFLEGRLNEDHLAHFRRECGGAGLSSYPHPWLMPSFWQFPTVSMGLGPISAIYQARYNRYLHNRGLRDTSDQRVWCYMGDGECDEPESLGALTVASREQLDNLTFVINCNLQRLDGPVRGNGKIIQELEATFRGAGWRVIKVIWGPEWDPLLAADTDGALVKRMNETVDGQFQKYSVENGDYVRKDFFGADPRVLKLVEHMSDDDLTKLRRGGHSYRKLYAAYKAAVEHRGQPVVILAKTVKGWTLGEGFEASNVTHQMKKLDEDHLRKFRDTLHLPIPDEQLIEAPPYYHPGEDSEEVQYLRERRAALGGYVPQRRPARPDILPPADSAFAEFSEGSKSGVEVSTTMAFVRLLRNLMRDKNIGKRVVPIVPDEGRTFGMDAFFREFGIYASQGQKYEPVDSKLFLNYHESRDGQLLEEGITEAGSMASFQAAATAYSTHGITTIPFYLFYSMFGPQRTADQIWQVGDSRGRGFMLGCTAGRTTLNGEGLQHGDGHSQLFAMAVPNMRAYDPAFAYETAAIVKDGLRRMLQDNEDVFYYITLYNENYTMPVMPEGVEEGILKGMYLFAQAPKKSEHKVQLMAGGTMMRAALKAQAMLADDFGVAANVFSVTSYQQLFRDARKVERINRLHPDKKAQEPYIARVLKNHQGPVITTQDWVQELPSMMARFIPNRFLPLGTNGFGRSDSRENLRRHFEIDAENVVLTALYGLVLEGAIKPKVMKDAMKKFGIDVDRVDPMEA